MKILLYIWSVVQLLLLITGSVWIIIDIKNKKLKKTPLILIAIGSFMMAIYFLVFRL